MASTRHVYRLEIQQMCFVSGETGEIPSETLELIEDIVREQVTEMLVRANRLAVKRGARSISTEDLLFLIRHDKAKVARLRAYLSWKDVRKNAKEQEGAGEATDLLDDSLALDSRKKRAKVGLPWDVTQMFSESVPEADDDDSEEILEANSATLERLRMADERTRTMTKDEYVHWSECRQASFTFRKGKRFRDWLNISSLVEGRLNDDLVDILGFLMFETVARITEEGLKVKEIEKKALKDIVPTKSRSRGCSLFAAPESAEEMAMEARHVREAFRRLQAMRPKDSALRAYCGGLIRTPIQLI